MAFVLPRLPASSPVVAHRVPALGGPSLSHCFRLGIAGTGSGRDVSLVLCFAGVLLFSQSERPSTRRVGVGRWNKGGASGRLYFASDPRGCRLRRRLQKVSAARAGKEEQEEGGGSGPAPIVSGLFVFAFVGALTFGISSLMRISFTRYAGLAFLLQWAFFLLQGWPQRSEKLYDASGSLTHLATVIAALTSVSVHTPRQLVAGILAIVWCTRLGTFLFNRIARDAKDDRFTALKTNFWSFSIAWNLQVAWVFMLQLPVVAAIVEPTQPALCLLDVAGWSLWSIGFLVEAAADAQKFAFRSDRANKGRFITEGLWRYSRHPNYFGEILMWVGICLSCSSCFVGWRWLGWLSPLFNAFLLLRVSGVPLLEKAGEAKWGSEVGYQSYMKNTSCVVPWFPAPTVREEVEDKKMEA